MLGKMYGLKYNISFQHHDGWIFRKKRLYEKVMNMIMNIYVFSIFHINNLVYSWRKALTPTASSKHKIVRCSNSSYHTTASL